MVLIVEDGSGLANSEAYISVADADSYFASLGEAAWAAASSTVREQALRRAASFLDDRYEGRWRGRKNTATQALRWPRYGVVTPDALEVATNSIPEKLRRANAVAALLVVQGVSLFVNETEGEGSLAAERIKVGPIEVDESFAGAKSTAPVLPEIDALLKDLLKIGTRLGRR